MAASVSSTRDVDFAKRHANFLHSREIAKLFLIGLPALLAGTWLGFRLFGRLDEAAFRKIVLVLLLASGIVLTI